MLSPKKRKALTVALLSTLLSTSIAGAFIIGITNANPMEPFFSGKIYSTDFLTRIIVKSPSHNALYSSRIIPFSVEVIAAKNWQLTSVKLVLYLDNLPVGIIFGSRGHYQEEGIFVNQNFVPHNKTVRVKEDGWHSLVVYAIVEYNYSHIASGQSGVVPFTVNNTAPQLTIISIENKTYSTANVNLDFVVNKPVSKFAYCLDGQNNVTVSGNSTLLGIGDGVHTIKMFSWDEVGNVGSSEEVAFTIANPNTSSKSEIDVVLGVAAFIYSGLLLYFLSFKRKKA